MIHIQLAELIIREHCKNLTSAFRQSKPVLAICGDFVGLMVLFPQYARAVKLGKLSIINSKRRAVTQRQRNGYPGSFIRQL